MSASDASTERPEAPHDSTIVLDKQVTLTLGIDSLLIVGKELCRIRARIAIAIAIANCSCRRPLRPQTEPGLLRVMQVK
jgi:hypothetical protein